MYNFIYIYYLTDCVPLILFTTFSIILHNIKIFILLFKKVVKYEKYDCFNKIRKIYLFISLYLIIYAKYLSVRIVEYIIYDQKVISNYVSLFISFTFL